MTAANAGEQCQHAGKAVPGLPSLCMFAADGLQALPAGARGPSPSREYRRPAASPVGIERPRDPGVAAPSRPIALPNPTDPRTPSGLAAAYGRRRASAAPATAIHRQEPSSRPGRPWHRLSDCGRCSWRRFSLPRSGQPHLGQRDFRSWAAARRAPCTLSPLGPMFPARTTEFAGSTTVTGRAGRLPVGNRNVRRRKCRVGIRCRHSRRKRCAASPAQADLAGGAERHWSSAAWNAPNSARSDWSIPDGRR